MHSLGCKLVRVGWVIYHWLFQYIHFRWSGVLTMPAKDPLKLKNLIETFFYIILNL